MQSNEAPRATMPNTCAGPAQSAEGGSTWDLSSKVLSYDGHFAIPDTKEQAAAGESCESHRGPHSSLLYRTLCIITAINNSFTAWTRTRTGGPISPLDTRETWDEVEEDTCLLVYNVCWAPWCVWVQQAMDGAEPRWVLLDRESSFHVDGIPLIFKHSIAQGDLLVNFRLRHLMQVLQVGVEQVTSDQLHSQHRLNDVTNGAVVRQADLFSSAHEVAATGPGAHLKGQTSTDAKARSSGSKPEINRTRFTLADSLSGLDGSVKARFPNINILGVRISRQQLYKCFDVHVVIVVDMAKPLPA